MIDIHCHLMPEVDDGSRSLKESLHLLEKAANSGVSDIILTPHYINHTEYNVNNQTKAKITQVLKNAIKKAGLDINLYFGNEAYIDVNMPELIESGQVSTLAGSRYLLLELPVEFEDKTVENLVERLDYKDIKIIIAHPERYRYFIDDPKLVDKYLDFGCLLQGDYKSLFGKYGRDSEKTLKKLLKRGKITFMASDIHRETSNYNIEEAYEKTRKIVKKDSIVLNLFENNPRKILNNELF